MQLPGQDLGPHAHSEARRPGGASMTPASSALAVAKVLAKQRKKEGIVVSGLKSSNELFRFLVAR